MTDKYKRQKKYYRRNREKILRHSHEYYLKHKEEKRAYGRKYYSKPEVKERCRKLAKRRIQKRRLLLIKLLGNKCVKCGFDDWRALQIDHIHGGGNKERKKRKHMDSYYKSIIESVKRGEKKYQLLCANCNWIKKYENSEA